MADTLGTLSIAIEGDLKGLKSSISEAEKLIKTFTSNINKDLTNMEGKLAKTNLGSLTKNVASVSKDVSSLAFAFKTLPESLKTGVYGLKTELGNLKASIEPSVTAINGLSKAFNSLALSIQKTADASVKLPLVLRMLQQFNIELQNLARSNGIASTTVGNLSGVVGNFNSNIRHAGNSLSLLKNQFNGVNSSATGLIQTITGLNLPLNQMIGRIILINTVWKAWGATLGLVREGITTVIQLDQALRNIQAVTLTFGKEFEAIQNKIRTAMLTTAFSAKELADAYVVLGQAGLTGKESTQAFDAVIQLAAASMTSLSEAANILTTILRTYDIQASESTDVTNQLISATNLSKLSIEGLNTALNFAGPAAAEAGLSLNQTLGALAVMADRGIKASTQGTGLRQVLSALIDPSANFREKLNELGISLNEVNPLTNDFADILELLKERGFTAADAFESLELRTAGTAAVLVRGANAFRTISDTIKDSNAGLAAQIIQQQGLESQFNNLKNRFFETFLGPGGIEGALRKVIDVLDVMIDKFTYLVQFLRANKDLVGALFGIAGVGVAGVGLKSVGALGSLLPGAAATGAAGAATGTAVAGGAAAAAGTGLLARVGLAGVGLTTGLTQLAIVIGSMYTAWQLFQLAFNKWTEEDIPKATNALEETDSAYKEFLKKQEEIEKLQKAVDQRRKTPAVSNPVVSLNLGDGTTHLIKYTDALDRLKTSQQEYKDLLKPVAKELATTNAQLIAQAQNLEGSRLNLKDLMDELLEQVAKAESGAQNYNEVLAARIALEQELEVSNISVGRVLDLAKQKLDENTDSTEKLNAEIIEKMRITREVLPILDEQLIALNATTESQNANATPIRILTELQRQLNQELIVFNEQLGLIPPSMRAFNAEYKASAKVISDIIKEAANSADPVGALKQTEANFDAELAGLDEQITQMAESLETLNKQKRELQDKFTPEQLAELALLDQSEQSIDPTASAVLEVNEQINTLSTSLETARARAKALRDGLVSAGNEGAQAQKNANKSLDDQIRANKKRFDIEEQTLLARIESLKNQQAIAEKKANNLLFGSLEQKKAQLEVDQAAAKISEYEIKLAERHLKLLNENKTATEARLNLILKTNPNDKSPTTEELRDRLDNIKLEIERAKAEFDKRVTSNQVTQLANQFKEQARAAEDILDENKEINRVLEVREQINKKLARQNEVEVELLRSKKDLAVSAQQEREFDLEIARLETEELHRQMDEARFVISERQRIIDNNKEILSQKNPLDEEYKKAERITEEALKQQELQEATIETAQTRLKLLDIELEKTDAVNNAWRDVARTVNDGYAKAVTDILFGKSNKDALKEYKDAIVNSFKNAFTESIKSKVTLLDKPFKGNILELGSFVVKTLSGAFKQGYKKGPGLEDKDVQDGAVGAGGIGGGEDFFVDEKGNKKPIDGTPGEDGKKNEVNWTKVAQASVLLVGSMISSYVFKLKDDAKGLEKTLNDVAKTLQTVASVITTVGGLYGAIAGAVLYIVSWLVPFAAPDRGREYLKSGRNFYQRAFLAAGGDNLLLPIPTSETYGRSSQVMNQYEPRTSMSTSASELIFGNFTNTLSSVLSVILGPQLGAILGGLFGGGGELAAMDKYIRNVASNQDVFLSPQKGSRARYEIATTDAFVNTLVSRGYDEEKINAIVQAMSALEIVKASATKKNKTFELAQTQVNASLAQFLELNYDLDKVDTDILFRQFAGAAGSFDKVLQSINVVYQNYLDGKTPGFDMKFLENVITGATTLFSDSFPKGVNVARRALSILAREGKIEMSALQDSIKEVVTAVTNAASKIVENPLKILVDTGSSTQALNDFGIQVDSFIKDTLLQNVTSLISNSVIEQGFLTPIFEDIQDLSTSFYNAELNASQFGAKVRTLFTQNLIPNIGVFKNILKDTFATFGETLGFPLDNLGGLFGERNRSGGFGLSFESRLYPTKSFTQTYLNALGVSDEVAAKKDTVNRIQTAQLRLGTDLIPESTKLVIIQGTMAEILAQIFNNANAVGGVLDVEDIDTEKLEAAVRKFIFSNPRVPFAADVLKQVKNPVTQVTVKGIIREDAGTAPDNYAFVVELSYRRGDPVTGNIKVRESKEIELGGTGEGTGTIAQATTAATKLRTELLSGFLTESGIDKETLNELSKREFNVDDFTLLRPDQLAELFRLPEIQEAIGERGDEIAEEIINMGTKIKKSLNTLARNITSADEFGALFSAVQQALDDNFLDEEEVERIVKRGLKSLQEELASSIDVTAIFEAALDEDGLLDVEQFRRVLNAEVEAFNKFQEGVKNSIVSALSDGKVLGAVDNFKNYLKRSLGDAVIEALVSGITNKIFIDQIFGPFLSELGVRVAAFGRGQITTEDINAFIQRELPGVTGAINNAGTVLTPLLESVYAIFESTGLITAYNSALDKQEELINKQLDVAKKWDEILKSARAVRSEILFGVNSPQQLRAQIKDAQIELNRELAIFRTATDEEQRQEAASKAVSLVQRLFQLGNSAGEAGLADFQKTAAGFQVFSKNLVGILDEITNAAINGSSQLELLQKQVDLLTQIEANTRGKGNLGLGDPNATGGQTERERSILRSIDAERRRYLDQEDFRRTAEWELMSEEERQVYEDRWKSIHDLFDRSLDAEIDKLKQEDRDLYTEENKYRRSTAYLSMTREQQNAWDDTVRAAHQRNQDIIDSLEQAYEEAIIAADEYRSQEPPPEPAAPALDKETVVDLKTSNMTLNTSIQELNDSIIAAYKLEDPEKTADLTYDDSTYDIGDPGTSAFMYDQGAALTIDGGDSTLAGLVDKIKQASQSLQSLVEAILGGSAEPSIFDALVQKLTAANMPVLEVLDRFIALMILRNQMPNASTESGYLNNISITIQGNATPETVAAISGEVEKVLLRSIRIGRGGVEVRRKVR